MKVIVTGGSGFIGTNYIQYLLDEVQADVINIDKAPPKNSNHQTYWRECNILHADKTSEIIADFNPDFVVHLAADLGTDLVDIEDFKANFDGVENLIEACKRAPNLKRVVFTSSLLVCKVGYKPKHDTDYMPSTAYGKSKMMGEEIVRNAGELPFARTIIRPISIWGPWQGEPYLNFFKAVSQGWYFHIGDGHYMRSLGYVRNSVRQIHSILETDLENIKGKTFYIADSDPADLHEMAEIIRESTGARKIRTFPVPLAKTVALIGDLLQKTGWRTVPLTSFRLNNITTEYVFDLSPIMNLIRFEPTGLKTAIDETLHHMDQYD